MMKGLILKTTHFHERTKSLCKKKPPFGINGKQWLGLCAKQLIVSRRAK